MAHRPRDTPVAHGQDAPYARQVFVCTTGPECPKDGPAVAIRGALKKIVKERGLQDQVRINHSGCLGQCGHGPVMVVHPDNVWYSHLDEADALEVLEAHILGDQGPVERLRYRLGPGGVKATRDEDGASTCDGAGCRT